MLRGNVCVDLTCIKRSKGDRKYDDENDSAASVLERSRLAGKASD